MSITFCKLTQTLSSVQNFPKQVFEFFLSVFESILSQLMGLPILQHFVIDRWKKCMKALLLLVILLSIKDFKMFHITLDGCQIFFLTHVTAEWGNALRIFFSAVVSVCGQRLRSVFSWWSVDRERSLRESQTHEFIKGS